MIDNLIIGDRQTGKTTQLIRMAAAEGKYIVVPNDHMKDDIVRHAKDMELNILNPVSFRELPFSSRFAGEVLVDEPQMILEKVIGASICGMTACGNNTIYCCHDLGFYRIRDAT